jgi:hypothetical protein
MSGDQLIEATFIHLGLCEEAFYIAEIAITAITRNLSDSQKYNLSASYLHFGDNPYALTPPALVAWT